ncbi:GH92 family glycosyl hydrolase [Flavihumibacter fluvii]|uniref:GH92 family glycosyl hydrolase n=1 Tax=Flavihumibacter fluvii TaxID=2838157 RepID=UPI001BDDD9BE|nr:GH92 family glycosyl hydrolase [Flavihumibacter fluvii]ULQ54742.1 GH92 family glycosyl hydrolase [Flavihumibacter fluvii]
MKISISVIGWAVLSFVYNNNKQIDYTKYVNNFIGTEGTGHTFPGPCMPFGMVQPGPDNADFGWDYTSGYQYKDSIIMGFSQTRANGTGISEFGDVLLQPFTDDSKQTFEEAYAKETENASPGYYTVRLNNKVKVELTCTERVALHQYTYPQRKALLLVDLQHGLRFLTDSLVLESQVKMEDNKTISGYCHTSNWVERKYFFTIRFNQPFTSSQQLEQKPKEAAQKFVLRFDLDDKVLQAKIALSTVSVEGAKSNLQKELPGWDFSTTVANAKRVWNSYLSRIEIEAGQKEKGIFYSCMYRLFLQPSNITDIDGRYRGADDSIRTAKNGEYYSTLSLWDTYRAAHPLYTLIAPEKVNGFINSMIEHSKAAGFLPIWTAWGKDNYCMIGNHAIPIITDAYLKGFTGFNAAEALQQMIRSTTENHINSNWTLLNKYGYYPIDSLDNEAVSRTLEHGVDDYCIGLMAQKKGNKEIAGTYFKRAAYYKNLYDTTTRHMRGKDSRGKWRSPFNPIIATSPMNNPGDYTEGNAWQYFWTPALYDVEGMMQLLGGKKYFTAQLDSFFTIKAQHPNKHLGQEAMIGQYAHGNEPSHHIAYLYAYSDKPERGREIITKICTEFYGNTSGGMIGNDDCGQMSAWYIFSTLGFYPVNPASGEYIIGQPQIKTAIVHLEDSKLLVINNHNTGSVKLNEIQISDFKLTHKQLSAGGLLNF